MNRIIIKGRLTRDPELKTGDNGTEYCKFTVAVDRRVGKDKEKKADEPKPKKTTKKKSQDLEV